MEPQPTTSREEEGGRRGPGKPALDPGGGAMTGEVLAKYKLEHQRETREAEMERKKKEKISEARRRAVSMRADRGGQEELLRENSSEREGGQPG